MCNARIYGQRLLYSAFLLGLVMAFLGCSRTVTGGFDDSLDKKYRVYGRVFGAYGRSFIDNSRKTVRISIVANDTNETLLFRKGYRVEGSDVSWDSTWDERNDLTVVIYDYGPGVLFTGLKKDAPPRRHIRTMAYQFDPKTGAFTEQAPK
jgi:hypothetical protein